MLYLVIMILFTAVQGIRYTPKYPDYRQHECKRNCSEHAEPKTCQYEFLVEWHVTNTPMCFNCSNGVVEDCENTECVVANGESRLIMVVNRMLPGPSIEVCSNDKIVVDVSNDLREAATTLHWHGMHQRGTQLNDGVPMISQCPIQPFNTWRYQFIAEPSGTHMYHSHIGEQRAMGLYGALIVHRPHEYHQHLYDYDLPEHVMLVQDWSKDTPFYNEVHVARFYHFDFSQIDTMVINGYGPSKHNNVPPKLFEVDKGYRYRFRVINVCNTICPVQIKVWQHRVLVISSDGSDINPEPADSFYIHVGETMDFILEANQTIDSYLITFEGSMICNKSSYAVLRYKGAKSRTFNFLHATRKLGLKGRIINCLRQEPNCRTNANLTAPTSLDHHLQREPDSKLILFLSVFYFASPSKRGPHSNNLTTAALDAIISTTATMPPYQNRNVKYCNNNKKDMCGDDLICECFHMVKIRKNAIIEIILVDEGSVTDVMTHTMHLHGFNFSVLGTGYFNETPTRASIEEMDGNGLLRRNLVNPITKDTVFIPQRGYAIIRFKADNPGYWLLHCHIDLHESDGMKLTLDVDGQSVKVPRDFPRCGDYKLNIEY